ncbi:DUF47 domain-containing protein [Alicyclobacillus acidiphilus]|uniref:DUF47 domain-containing protein n=1 Tax=Alicyclobacillus acidiphilus TaxID=182455 RepID=UPI0008312F5F|nr:DUF47 family protein [Alicyclobacillus acidiphilus]
MSKKSGQLTSYLMDIANNIRETTEVFEKGLTGTMDYESLAKEMKQYESTGDALTGNLLTLLNDTYIAPLEREDFVALATKLDDIIDGIHACSVRFTLYGVMDKTATMFEFAKDIHRCAIEIDGAVRKLNDRNFVEIRDHIKEINILEKHGDELLHTALRTLFAECKDPIELIKLKEIYEILENVTDRCENVADVLESVILKNA